jgi:glycine/D-amino acid oxidase-like deaminating enzyme
LFALRHTSILLAGKGHWLFADQAHHLLGWRSDFGVIGASCFPACAALLDTGPESLERSAMRVAVLGGGLQGCCVALSLANKGVAVTLIDRNPHLLSRTAVANEGKIHLGYMYAADPSFSTARRMMQGALAFAPFMKRELGISVNDLSLSQPATYVVHRDSQHGVDEVHRYLDQTHALIQEAAASQMGAYFGIDLGDKPRRRSGAELAMDFDPQLALAAFDTVEVAIDPKALAHAIRERIAQDRLIEVRLGTTVIDARERATGLEVTVATHDGRAETELFGEVVNALWDGRIALDAKLGFRPNRPWLHRLKYGVSFRIPDDLPRPPSATFVSGPFGEVVSYGNGLTYLTWYPTCLKDITGDLLPPHWETYPGEPERSEIIAGTLRAMAAIVPSLAALQPDDLEDLHVKGGAIVAWGSTDIYDPQSELHRRFEIGVTSVGAYHTIDPGKLTMAPFFAEVCAERIATRAAA